eukprot:gene21801-biopygen7592
MKPLIAFDFVPLECNQKRVSDDISVRGNKNHMGGLTDAGRRGFGWTVATGGRRGHCSSFVVSRIRDRTALPRCPIAYREAPRCMVGMVALH